MTTPRRVARIITRLNIGGPAIQAINLSRDLGRAGYDTCLIHGRLGPSEGAMTTLLPLGDTRARYLDSLTRQISPIRDVWVFWQLYRALCRWRPDIVHTHMAKAGALGRLAAIAYNRTLGRTRPARLVHTYHGHVFDGYFDTTTARVFRRVERWLGTKSDALIAISPMVRHDLLHTYGIAADDRKVHVVPLGFNLDRLFAITDADRLKARDALEIPPETVVISTVGRLTGIKNHSLFLEMAELLKARVDRLLFLVVGDGELRADLEAEARRRNLADVVRFLGWRGDLECIYGGTDVFVLTSKNEGTPVALIEAMASAVAPVSTDVGGVRDVIADSEAGALVPSGDAAALRDAVLRYIAAPSLRQKTAQAARRVVAGKFEHQRLLSDIEKLYGQLLDA